MHFHFNGCDQHCVTNVWGLTFTFQLGPTDSRNSYITFIFAF